MMHLFISGLRSLIYALYCIITVIPFAILALVLWVIAPPLVRFKVLRWWPKLATYMGRYVLGLNWVIKGIEHLPSTPVILMPKHQSTWETYFLCGFLNPYPVFIYKRELHHIPLFGWGLKSFNWIPINRNNPIEAFNTMKTLGRSVIDSGRHIVMFPEGTRTDIGKTVPYKSGGIRLAMHLNVPIVPIAHNAGAFWKRGKLIKQSGLITVSIGRPIDVEGKTMDTISNEVKAWIESEMKVIAPDYYQSIIN